MLERACRLARVEDVAKAMMGLLDARELVIEEVDVIGRAVDWYRRARRVCRPSDCLRRHRGGVQHRCNVRQGRRETARNTGADVISCLTLRDSASAVLQKAGPCGRDIAKSW